ncbi:uncharacterized protein ACIBXB_006301 [Morphnus guianensis]
MFQVLFRATKRLFKSTTQRSAPKLDIHGWHGMWEDMGRYLENFSPPVAWKFTPEQLQNPHEVVEYLKGKCCGYSKDVQLATLCWALASIYQTLLDIRQHPQGEKGEKMENRTTGTVATQTPTTGTVATPTPTTDTVATPTPVTDTAAKPENQPVPVSVAPVQKKKHTKKSVRLVRDEDEPGSSREQEEEAEPEIITQSLSLSELRDMRKDFSRHPGEHTVTWLLRCWDNGASSVELEGKEAKQLGSLSREGGHRQAIGSKHSSAQERGERKYRRRANLWFYLRDHGEDMRKWDGKPTSVLDARVRELREKATRKEDSSWKAAAPVSREQSPRRSRWADPISDPLEGTSDSRVRKE